MSPISRKQESNIRPLCSAIDKLLFILRRKKGKKKNPACGFSYLPPPPPPPLRVLIFSTKKYYKICLPNQCSPSFLRVVVLWDACSEASMRPCSSMKSPDLTYQSTKKLKNYWQRDSSLQLLKTKLFGLRFNGLRAYLLHF